MATELWIEELKMRAQRHIAIEHDQFEEISAHDLLKLIALATRAGPPSDALVQCQEREADLQEDLDDERHDNFDLRYENEHLSEQIAELELELAAKEAELDSLHRMYELSERA